MDIKHSGEMASDIDATCESDPNFAVICAFLEKFGAQCGLINVDFLELQHMLENNVEVPKNLIEMHLKLLRKIKKTVPIERWERVLCKVMHDVNVQDAWEVERFGYKKAKLSSKVRILKNLMEMQFDHHHKFKAEVNKLPPQELRSQPLGRDKSGHSYWFLNDDNYQIRVFKEDLDDETWKLVAKDREGLVDLINQLNDGDTKLSSDSACNEDSNSLSEKPILDTGQQAEDTADDTDIKDEDSTEEGENDTEDDIEKKVKREICKRPREEEPVVVLEKLPKITIKDFAKCEEVTSEIEEPVLKIQGEGSGEDNKSCPIIGEEIEEEVMYISGQGEGFLCNTGNEDKTNETNSVAIEKKCDDKKDDLSNNKEVSGNNSKTDAVSTYKSEQSECEPPSTPKKSMFFFGAGSQSPFKANLFSPTLTMGFGSSKQNEEVKHNDEKSDKTDSGTSCDMEQKSNSNCVSESSEARSKSSELLSNSRDANVCKKEMENTDKGDSNSDKTNSQLDALDEHKEKDNTSRKKLEETDSSNSDSSNLGKNKICDKTETNLDKNNLNSSKNDKSEEPVVEETCVKKVAYTCGKNGTSSKGKLGENKTHMHSDKPKNDDSKESTVKSPKEAVEEKPCIKEVAYTCGDEEKSMGCDKVVSEQESERCEKEKQKLPTPVEDKSVQESDLQSDQLGCSKEDKKSSSLKKLEVDNSKIQETTQMEEDKKSSTSKKLKLDDLKTEHTTQMQKKITEDDLKTLDTTQIEGDKELSSLKKIKVDDSNKTQNTTQTEKNGKSYSLKKSTQDDLKTQDTTQMEEAKKSSSLKKIKIDDSKIEDTTAIEEDKSTTSKKLKVADLKTQAITQMEEDKESSSLKKLEVDDLKKTQDTTQTEENEKSSSLKKITVDDLKTQDTNQMEEDKGSSSLKKIKIRDLKTEDTTATEEDKKSSTSKKLKVDDLKTQDTIQTEEDKKSSTSKKLKVNDLNTQHTMQTEVDKKSSTLKKLKVDDLKTQDTTHTEKDKSPSLKKIKVSGLKIQDKTQTEQKIPSTGTKLKVDLKTQDTTRNEENSLQKDKKSCTLRGSKCTEEICAKGDKECPEVKEECEDEAKSVPKERKCPLRKSKRTRDSSGKYNTDKASSDLKEEYQDEEESQAKPVPKVTRSSVNRNTFDDKKCVKQIKVNKNELKANPGVGVDNKEFKTIDSSDTDISTKGKRMKQKKNLTENKNKKSAETDNKNSSNPKTAKQTLQKSSNTDSTSINSPQSIESISVECAENSNSITSGDVELIPEKDPLAVSDDETVPPKKVNLSCFSLDFNDSPTLTPVPDIPQRRTLRKRGRSKSPVQVKPVEAVKKPKIKGKRQMDKNLRKSIEEQKNKQVSSSEDECEESTPVKRTTVNKTTPKKAKKGKKNNKGAVKKEKQEPQKKKVELSEESQDTPPEPKKKNRYSGRNRLLESLGVTDDQPLEAFGVRASRRLAQIKIKEQVEPKKHEPKIVETNDKKIKKKGNEEKDIKPEKRKRNKQEKEDISDPEVVYEKKKKKKKEKAPSKLFDHNRPWQSSSGESSEEPHLSEEEEEEHIEDFFVPAPRSDHEFSPESEVDDNEWQPLKRARTARKEDEKIDECLCQKCNKSDHPEWILLCDKCDNGWHCSCLRPPLLEIPEGNWFCPPCQHVRLLENLHIKLKEYDKQLNKKKLEDRRKERLDYVSISLNNVLTGKEEEEKKKKRRHSLESRSASSSDDASSSASESESDSDAPIYQLRQRRQTKSYKFNEYDEMIRSAIAEEGGGEVIFNEEKEKTHGRGKDINTIINAEKQEKEKEAAEAAKRAAEAAAANEEAGSEEKPPVVPKDTSLKSFDEETYKPTTVRKFKKKPRKLTGLDVSSEDDNSDEDFKGTSDEESEEDESIVDVESEDSDDYMGKKRRKAGPVRRSTRARVSRFDADFINDDNDSDEAPKKKKKKSIWDDTESEESDTWGGRKKRSGRSSHVSKKKKKKKKKKKHLDSDLEESKPKKPKSRIKYGGLTSSEEEDLGRGRRTRGKKTTYVDTLGSESEEEAPKKSSRRIESDDEDFVANEDDEKDSEENVEEPEAEDDQEEEEEEEEVEERRPICVPKIYIKKPLGTKPQVAPVKPLDEESKKMSEDVKDIKEKEEPVTKVEPETKPKIIKKHDKKVENPEELKKIEAIDQELKNTIEEINKDLEEMPPEDTEKLMEEEEFANRQLQMMAERLKQKKQLESAGIEIIPIPKATPVKPSIVHEPIVGNVSALLKNDDENDDLSEPPGIALPMFTDLKPTNSNPHLVSPPVLISPEDSPKKRRGRGKGKKTLEKEARLAAEKASRENQLPPAEIEIAAPPQPFSQTQPTPSVITRMLQSKPGQATIYPVGSIRPKQFATMPVDDDDEPLPTPKVDISRVPPTSGSGPYLPGLPHPNRGPPHPMPPGSPHYRPPPGMNHYSPRGIPPGMHGPPTNHPIPPTSHQGPPPGYQLPPAGHQGSPLGHQLPPPRHPGPPAGHQGSPRNHQGPPPGLQGPPPGHQGPPNHHQIPPRGRPGPPPTHQAPPPTRQVQLPPRPQGPPSSHTLPPRGPPPPMYRHRAVDPSPSGGGTINMSEGGPRASPQQQQQQQPPSQPPLAPQKQSHPQLTSQLSQPSEGGAVTSGAAPVVPPPVSSVPPSTATRYPPPSGSPNVSMAGGHRPPVPYHFPSSDTPPPPQTHQSHASPTPPHPPHSHPPPYYGEYHPPPAPANPTPPAPSEESGPPSDFEGQSGFEEEYNGEESANGGKFEESESGGEFGGLVSYFSSQHEDDLDS